MLTSARAKSNSDSTSSDSTGHHHCCLSKLWPSDAAIPLNTLMKWANQLLPFPVLADSCSPLLTTHYATQKHNSPSIMPHRNTTTHPSCHTETQQPIHHATQKHNNPSIHATQEHNSRSLCPSRHNSSKTWKNGPTKCCLTQFLPSSACPYPLLNALAYAKGLYTYKKKNIYIFCAQHLLIQ
jgi:hypothetical protein